MSHPDVTPTWIAEKAGVAVRTVQRAAKRGEFEAPLRTSKYHRQYPMTKSLHLWIERKRRMKGKQPSTKPDWRKDTFLGTRFPTRSVRKWLRLVHAEIQKNDFDCAWSLMQDPELREMAFIYLAALTHQHAVFREHIWKSPETIASRFGEETGNLFALDLAKFLRKFFPMV